jgi:hypothetical protein
MYPKYLLSAPFFIPWELPCLFFRRGPTSLLFCHSIEVRMIKDVFNILANPSKFSSYFHNLFAATVLTSTRQILIGTIPTRAPTTEINNKANIREILHENHNKVT